MNLSEHALENLPEKVTVNIGKGGNAKATPKTFSKPIAAPQQPSAPLPLPAPTQPTPSGTDSPTSSTESSDLVSDRRPSEISTGMSSNASWIDLAEAAHPKKVILPPAVEEERPLKFLRSEPVSFAQSRFWFLRMLLQDQTTFTIALFYKVTGNLRIGDLERAVLAVGSRHESLRTAFVGGEMESDMACQKIMASSKLRLEHKKINGLEDVQAEYASFKAHVYNIENGEAIRMMLMTVDPSTHYLLIGYRKYRSFHVFHV